MADKLIEKTSRVSKSLKNAKIALGFYLINLILQFFYRKIFLTHLGAEFLGLNTTAMNLLQFLNLTELGIGAAVSYTLYKPLLQNNKDQINEIVSVQGFLYNRIGIIIILLSIILMLFFPYFFSDIKVPMWYTYASFGVLLVSALSTYFFNYQEIVLISDQKEYKINYVTQGIKIFKILFQIFCISLLAHGYVWWLLCELAGSLLIVFGIRYIVRKEYPWLNTNIIYGKSLLKKYADITKKTKQLFAHKIAAFALNQSSPLIIFAYTNLSFVAVYGNYLLVFTGVTALLGAIFNSINAGVGNLVSEGNKDKIISVFIELFTIRFFLTCVACYSIYKLSPIFIYYWLGSTYLMDNSILVLLVFILFVNLSRLTVDSFINAYGLFNDIGAAIIEASLNIGLSIILGYYFGVVGVLCGVGISLIAIILIWKPYFLFKRGLKINISDYMLLYIKLLGISVSIYIICNYLESYLNIDPYDSPISFALYSFIIIFIFMLLLFIVLLICMKGMRQSFSRITTYLKKDETRI